MGFQDRLEKRAASFGAEHPTITIVLVASAFAWIVATALDRLGEVYRPGDASHAIVAGIAALGVNAWWAHIALIRDYNMGRAEKILIRLLMFGSTLPMIAVFEKNLLPDPLEVTALSYATALLISSLPLLIAGWWKGRKLSSDERLREAARGHSAVYGGEPSWAEEDRIGTSLRQMERLLQKHNLTGQAEVVRQARSAHTGEPAQFQELIESPEMWGGAGAVWEVHLTSHSRNAQEALADQQRFQEALIQLVEALEEQGLATERARSIASTFKTSGRP